MSKNDILYEKLYNFINRSSYDDVLEMDSYLKESKENKNDEEKNIVLSQLEKVLENETLQNITSEEFIKILGLSKLFKENIYLRDICQEFYSANFKIWKETIATVEIILNNDENEIKRYNRLETKVCEDFVDKDGNVNLQGLLNQANREPKKKNKRDHYLSGFVKYRTKDENGNCCCDMCGQKFIAILPLEAHHIIPFSSAGIDQPYNMISLCSNCHTEIHYHGLTYNQQAQLLLKLKSYLTEERDLIGFHNLFEELNEEESKEYYDLELLKNNNELTLEQKEQLQYKYGSSSINDILGQLQYKYGNFSLDDRYYIANEMHKISKQFEQKNGSIKR